MEYIGLARAIQSRCLWHGIKVFSPFVSMTWWDLSPLCYPALMSLSSQNNHDTEVFWYQCEASEEPALTNLPFLYFPLDFLSWNLFLCSGHCSCPVLPLGHWEFRWKGVLIYVSGSYMLCWCSLFKVHFKYSFYQFDCQWEFLLKVYSTGFLMLFTCYFWISICVCLCVCVCI